jgi:phenylalanyl-tRNA synthetase alpha chain
MTRADVPRLYTPAPDLEAAYAALGLEALEAELHAELAQAGEELAELKLVEARTFGQSGKLTALLRGLGQLAPDEKRARGRLLNEVRAAWKAHVDARVAAVAAAEREAELRRNKLDLTLPGRRAVPRGALHPVTRVVRELEAVFQRLGFRTWDGPEVELDWFNFEALNFPPDHPARDMQDTFFVRSPEGRASRGDRELLLRTHTSPVQIRALLQEGAPIRAIMPGRVYRCDSDATHSPMFHQIEGLLVDEGISLAHLRGTMTSFLGALFGARPVRFRPSFFPFVEPGVEVDIQCAMCGGTGCRICKHTGWVEILGAGMVHPAVLESCGVDSERYTGFAFGLGIDRIAMSRWAIDDLAHLFRGDVRFLEQL